MLQRIPDSNHTAYYNVFPTKIIQNVLQHTPDSNHTECCNTFQTVIIQNATIYSRLQSHRMLYPIPEDSNHTACHRTHSRRPGFSTYHNNWCTNTLGGLLNMSLEICLFLLMKLFSGKKQTYVLRNTLIKCWIIRISELLNIRLKEFCCISIIKYTIRENWKQSK
jgi:hypothetical protein